MDDYDEEVLGNDKAPTKKPFKILEIAIKRIVDFAIPLHIRTLEAQCVKITSFQVQGDLASTQSHQLLASNTVRLLKSDLYELQSLSNQVEEQDVPLFHEKVEASTRDIACALENFLINNSEAMHPLPSQSNDSIKYFKPLICKFDEPACDDSALYDSETNNLQQLQVNAEPMKQLKLSQKLMKEICELNELFVNFTKFVFGQKKQLDSIEDNVIQAQANVLNGTKNLKKAVVLKAATFPVSGALIGGILLGPVGAVAGFKLFGILACAASGSALGFGAGMKLKKRQQNSCNIEMETLNGTRQLSLSSPDLHSEPQDSEECKKKL